MEENKTQKYKLKGKKLCDTHNFTKRNTVSTKHIWEPEGAVV